MEQIEFEKQLELVISALSAAGYDPLAQLTGYLQTGDATFITRQRNARDIIRSLDKEQLAEYVKNNM